MAEIPALGVYLGPLSPLIATLAVTLLWVFLIGALLLCGWPSLLVCKPYEDIESVAQELVVGFAPTVATYPERMMWTLSTGVCILATFLALYLVIRVMLSTASLSRTWRLAAFVWPGVAASLLGLGAAGYLPIPILSDGNDPALIFFHSKLTENFPAAEVLTVSLDMVGVCTAILLALAASWILLPSIHHKGRWADIPRLNGQLQLVLYCGAVVLVAHTLRGATLFNWSVAFFGNDPGGEALNRFAQAMAVGRGVVFTIFLAAIYVPAAISLARRAGVDSPQPVDESWAAPLLRQLTSILAILAPLLSTPIADILGALLGQLDGGAHS